jgi:hypothetical protein
MARAGSVVCSSCHLAAAIAGTTFGPRAIRLGNGLGPLYDADDFLPIARVPGWLFKLYRIHGSSGHHDHHHGNGEWSEGSADQDA